MMVLKCDQFGADASYGHGAFVPWRWPSLVKERQLADRSWLLPHHVLSGHLVS